MFLYRCIALQYNRCSISSLSNIQITGTRGTQTSVVETLAGSGAFCVCFIFINAGWIGIFDQLHVKHLS